MVKKMIYSMYIIEEVRLQMFENIKDFLPVKTEFEIGTAMSVLGMIFVYLIGSFDKLIESLLVLMCIDYISGIIAAYESCSEKLDSRRGFKGIGKKVMILLLVAVAHFVDYATGQELIRSMIIFFFIGNEGLSILENAVNAGVPVPAKLKASLEQLAEEKKQNNRD